MNASNQTLFSFTEEELFYLRVSLLHYACYLAENDLDNLRREVHSLYEQLASFK